MFIDRTLFVILFLVFSIGFSQESEINVAATNLKIDSLHYGAVNAIEQMDYDSSLEQLDLAKSLSEKINNKSKMALSSSIISRVYYQMKEYKMAAKESVTAINMQRELEDIPELGKSYITYAEIQISLGNYDNASEYLFQAEKIITELGDSINLAKVFLAQGNIAKIQKNYGLALTKYDDALTALNKAENKDYLTSKVALQKAATHLELEEYDKAQLAGNRALDISTRNNSPFIEMEALSILSKVEAGLGNHEQAYTYLNSYLSKQKLFTAAGASIEEKTAIKNALTTDLALEDYIPGKRSQASKISTVLVIALFTILCLLALSLYKNNNLRAKANELLQTKNTELMIAKDNAEKASMVKAQFLSTITHELRTPMYAVTGLTHLLLSENPTEEQKKHLDSLKFSGEYLLSLINNILDLNKLEANKVEVEQTSFNLRKRVDDVLFALERSAQEKGNKLQLEFDQEIPDQIIGDPLMISQILINLIGNSNKFTREGEIFVRVQKISKNEKQIYLHFEVEDTGEGISKKKQKDIFQNFTQGSVQINRKFGGTGLGLSIVKRLLNLQGSKIQLESTLGKGSKFFFDIKYTAVKIDKENAGAEESYDIDYKALEGLKLLIVEDNKINQMITRKILEKHNIECEVADNGEIAVEKIRFEPYDLILMDIHMPGISGIEATKIIREFNKDVPILALTAVTIDENIDNFYLAGFNDIIPKPYKVEEFFYKIHNSIKRKNVNI